MILKFYNLEYGKEYTITIEDEGYVLEDEEEAILQMELLNHDFFMFKNIDEECISVIYKRKDGKFGILNSK